ncbi:acyl-CoA dehydrogenase [Mycobacterium heckeshornense]|uniref:Acyl-CoA dehydrogenase n=1 Tax=Mycobacterium heckeshornense TaxID=110505 RepID=A0A2G8B5V9_9MYCO|nr:acyl-CoA dehydrogenase family protein [Mycobacterium heckeshornense]KMV22762.1 acyl-CoA dehydrogenase [Mycobacterium heckeshornense]MCV7033987.1 acyl-CoA/acyl-ACP dehydrogenase [Mycobacterium heckeshornense]PIJ33118.1 acyl-CoA dehydrogenase [Mycobacterium heckeshornense]BCO37204.1 acyl-CoA dehydrogenase [Mycobacterium heckeshornense]
MNLEFNDEQLALRDTVRRFLVEKATIAGHVRPLLDDPTGVNLAAWHGLAGLGTTGLLVPQDYGGAGMTMVEAGIVLEELGAALYPGPWLSTAVAATRALSRFGAGDNAARLFTGIADGSMIATAGPLDLNRARPKAAVSSDATVLSGAINLLPDAAAADVLLIVADDADGPALFAVETSSNGLVVTQQPGIDQTRKQFRVILDDAPAQRLAAVAPDALTALIDDVLVAAAADALGAARAVMDSAIEYAKVRKQFGQPIGAFQAVQHLCVDMYETVELARGGVMYALWAADRAGSHERHVSALRAKAFAGRLASVGDVAIQVFGGIGYTWEHHAHLYLKRLLGWHSFLGGPDRYLEQVGAQLVRRSARSNQ